MERRLLTARELRTAAQQAITVALSTLCDDARHSLLKTAERLIREAETLDNRPESNP